MDSSEPVRYWSKGEGGKALLPLCSQQGPAQLHTTLQPGWGLKLPWLRALQNQHLQSRPSCRRGPRSHPNSLPAWHPGKSPHGPSYLSCAPHTNPCTAPVPRCAPQSSLHHSSVTAPVCCCKAQPDGQFPEPPAPLSSSRLRCCSHRGSPAPGSGSLPQLLPAGSSGIKGKQWLVGIAAPDLEQRAQGEAGK